MNKESGLIKLIIMMIVAIIILGVFNIKLESILKNPTVQENFSFAWQEMEYIWNRYLDKPAAFIWGVFYNLLWRSFVENMERIRGGKFPDIIEKAIPIDIFSR